MTDIALVATEISMANQLECKVKPYVAGVAITKGQFVAVDSTTGKLILADANVAGSAQQCKGMALNDAGIGYGVDVLEDGEVYGFTVAGLAYDALLYLSDTAGAAADAVSATKTVVVGRVVPVSNNVRTKLVRITTKLDGNW